MTAYRRRIAVTPGAPPAAAGGVAEEELLRRAEGLRREAWDARTVDTPKAVALAAEALALVRKAAGAADPFAVRLLESQVCFALCATHERLSQYDEALRAGEEALRLSDELLSFADPADGAAGQRAEALLACANALNGIANVYNRRGEYAAALENARRNLDLLTELGDAGPRAHALLRVGDIYYRLGDFAAAMGRYQEAMAVFVHEDDPRGLGAAWNGMGNVQFSEGRYEESLASYVEALAQFEKIGDPYWRAGLMSNVAGVHLKQGRLAEAREWQERSLRLREAFGEKNGQAYSLNSLADICRREGDRGRARECGGRALALFEEMADLAGQATVRVSLAAIAEEDGDAAASVALLREALGLSQKTGLRELEYQVEEQLSLLFERLGDAAAALRHYKRFHEGKEALFNEASDRKLRNLEVLHRVEQARREADLLRRHNGELAAANARQAELLDQLRRQSALLERQARTDALTGLLNRRSMEEAFTTAHREARAKGEPMAVALIDIDRFKGINDRFSHQVGDAVLRSVARLLQQNCRAGDALARYGGEEFLLVLPGATLDSAAATCERMRRLVERHGWSDLHPDLRVTVSFGLTGDVSHPDPEWMLTQADARLYEAKAAGRNRVHK